MRVSDYIVEFLLSHNIKHVFGYPGGMVTYLMDSFSKYDNIHPHVCYHEQAAAFEACAYAQASNTVGVAYATSGPGATNMITGICNAYFDSVPVLFITGQVNTFESGADYQLRQRGFQETAIVNMVQDVTKYAVYVESAEKIKYYLEKAYTIALSGRKGPVLLDIPMNIQRTEVDVDSLESYTPDLKVEEKVVAEEKIKTIEDKLIKAKRPCLILGAAMKQFPKSRISEFVDNLGIPVVTSMMAIDLLAKSDQLNYGFIGAYGDRTANFVVAKSDLIVTLGSRLDVRQVGGKRDNFAPNATIIRIDIDEGELLYQIRKNENDICMNVEEILAYFEKKKDWNKDRYHEWLDVCNSIRHELSGIDDRIGNNFVKNISKLIPDGLTVTTDVGQNQVWVAQSYQVKKEQKILFSGGHGAMGYSLPAAIGVYYATQKPVISFNGDGGIQMNIQELEFIRREKLPIKIIVFNNYALGMIRHFQEMYFQCNYTQTVYGRGYETPDFEKIAEAYHMPYFSYEKPEEVTDQFMQVEGAVLVEIKIPEDTFVFPKLEFGKMNQDQEPLLPRDVFQRLMEM